MNNNIKAVIFDLDGVIVCTDELHYKAWSQLAEREGIYFDKEINDRLRGVSRMASLEIILEKAEKTYSAEEKQEMCDYKNSLYVSLLSTLSPDDILPGVEQTLDKLTESRIKIAIGSSSRNTKAILERIGLANRFDAIADGTEISNSKPHPEVFLLAAAKLGIEPQFCAVVEDAAAGIEAAKNAGMTAFAVGADAASCERTDISLGNISELSEHIISKGANTMHEFSVEKVTDTITRITAFNTEMLYLVEGSERAALIDTGSGFGYLRACVEKLTDKPLIVLLTHGHTDHAMGADEFKTVYMNLDDEEAYTAHGDKDFRINCMKMNPEWESFLDEYIPTMPFEKMLPMHDGDIYNLGDINIECISCPGHTKGSMVMLIQEERCLMLGDACNGLTFVFDRFSTDIPTYKKSLERVKALTDGRYDRVLLSHAGGEGAFDLLESNIALCQDIIDRNVDDEPFEFMGQPALLAKKAPHFQRVDGGSGNIVYRLDKIGR